jgi:hypothetical protein
MGGNLCPTRNHTFEKSFRHFFPVISDTGHAIFSSDTWLSPEQIHREMSTVVACQIPKKRQIEHLGNMGGMRHKYNYLNLILCEESEDFIF